MSNLRESQKTTISEQKKTCRTCFATKLPTFFVSFTSLETSSRLTFCVDVPDNHHRVLFRKSHGQLTSHSAGTASDQNHLIGHILMEQREIDTRVRQSQSLGSGHTAPHRLPLFHFGASTFLRLTVKLTVGLFPMLVCR